MASAKNRQSEETLADHATVQELLSQLFEKGTLWDDKANLYTVLRQSQPLSPGDTLEEGDHILILRSLGGG